MVPELAGRWRASCAVNDRIIRIGLIASKTAIVPPECAGDELGLAGADGFGVD